MNSKKPADRAPKSGPSYKELADHLLERIENGELGPGDRLPTEAQLRASHGVSSTTVRAAVKLLAADGIVETRQGAGSFVAIRNLIQIRATFFEDLNERAGVLTQGAWPTEVLKAGKSPSTNFECLNVVAPKELGELLEVEPKATLVMRRAWRFVDASPSAIEIGYFPQWLVAELPHIASPEVIQQGTTSWLSEHGYPSKFHQDYITARPHTREEAKFFESPSGIASLVRRRVSFAGDEPKPIRVIDTIYRSDMTEVIYEIPGRGNKNRSS